MSAVSEGAPLRRVASQRKRRGSHSSKTPKKCRQSTTPSKSVAADPWIENSFLSGHAGSGRGRRSCTTKEARAHKLGLTDTEVCGLLGGKSHSVKESDPPVTVKNDKKTKSVGKKTSTSKKKRASREIIYGDDGDDNSKDEDYVLQASLDDSMDNILCDIDVPVIIGENSSQQYLQSQLSFMKLAPQKLLSETLIPSTPQLYSTQHEFFAATDHTYGDMTQVTQISPDKADDTLHPHSEHCDIQSSQKHNEPTVSEGQVQINSCDRNTKFSEGGAVGLAQSRELVGVTDMRDYGGPASVTSGPVMSFRERLKNKLLENTKVPTPKSARKVEKIRQEMVNQAIQEAEKLQKLGLGDNRDWSGDFYGLSSHVKELFETQRNIKKLYDWQHECLSLPSLAERKNLVYSLPTSGGKTLVAEILMLRELLVHKRDAILILPFVSIVQEKVKGLSSFAVELDFLVEEYAASKGHFPPKKRQKKKSIFICTIEKANSLVNSLIEHGRLDNVGLTVVDELHMIGEGGSRGATLEMSLVKLMHASPETQIIGMSATLNNINDLQLFLEAEIYSNDFRPVELQEYVKIEDTIYAVDGKALCPEDRITYSRALTIKHGSAEKQQDPDHLAGLIMEVIPKHSCLTFCATKKNCENVAELVCRLMPKAMLSPKKKERQSLLQALLFDGSGQVCPVLQNTIPYGVAYHHSGLTMDERKLIEEAYSEGTLCMLACTSTLAAGVNLPAKRVILRSPYVAREFLSRSQYKQMVGRAGRAGIDSSGESIVVMQRRDKLKLLDLVGGPYDHCKSSLLYEDKKGIRSLLLTTIGLQITPTMTSVCRFLRKTLCHIQNKHQDSDLLTLAKDGLQSLLNLRLIRQKRGLELGQISLSQGGNGPPANSQTSVMVTPESQRSGINNMWSISCSPEGMSYTLEVTKLGRAVFKGSIDIDRGPQLYKDLMQAGESLVVVNHLHLLYIVTPYDMTHNVRPQWMVYLDELSCMDSAELTVANLIGVSESYVAKKIAGQPIRKPVDESVIKRFYLTLVLYNLWKQRSIWDVASKFTLARGYIQQLLNSAASFAACVSHFCQELEEFWAYQDILINFVRQLSYCVNMDLIPLMEIPGVKIGRARQLFTAGVKTLQQVAFSDPEKLVRDIEHMPKKTARQIVDAAKMLLKEKAEALVEEADELIAMPEDIQVALEFDVEMLPVESEAGAQES